MSALLLQIIPLIVSSAPHLINEVKAIINNAKQNKELTDEEHAALIAAFILEVQTDPAWKIEP